MDVRNELNDTTFVWNVEKARLNARNQGVAFEQAAEVFFASWLTQAATTTPVML